MPWYMPNISISLTEAIKKRVCIYLLQRYLGQFLEEKLTLDQLSVDLYNGRGTVENVSLDMQALNELGEKQNWPMEFVNGTLEKITFSVPWSSILKDSTFIEIHGLKVTVQPKQRNECATSMFESMWSSMTNSMQLAQECMKQEAANIDNSQPLEGIEIVAQALDSILSRVKVKFIDTVIQVEHVPKDSLTGVGLIISIAHMEYLDEAGNDPPTGETSDHEQTKAYIVSSFTTKTFHMEGVSLSTVEFSSRARTFSRSVIMTQSLGGDKEKADSLVTLLEEQTLEGDNNGNGEGESFDDERHVVLFAKFAGTQEIRVRMKQSEDVNGPKVSIEINLGAFSLFLSPRQVYVLLELANGLSSPDTEDTSNVAPRQKCMEKPMSGLDYQRVEQELQQQLHPSNAYISGLQGIHGWSTAALEESDNDENFLPMKPNACSATMYDSAMSTASSSMESSLSSSMASSLSEATSNRTRKRASNIDSDPTAEISHFHIRLASLALVLLHDDILLASNDNSSPTLVLSSVKQMQNTAFSFFNNLGLFVVAGYGKRNFDDCRGHFEKACKLSHIRLLAAPLQIECDETTTLTAFSLSGKLTAAKMEILECLNQGINQPMDYVRMLSFEDEAVSVQNHMPAKPCFKLAFKHIEKTVKTGMARRVFIPKTEFSITLDTSTIEVDITLMDRISALIHGATICVIQKPQNVWGNAPPASNDFTSTPTESQMDIKLTSPSLSIKLRFPIPDFRPPHDMQRVPWWKRNVRQSYILVRLMNAQAQTTIQTHQLCQKYSLQAKVIHADYYEKEGATPLHIAKAGVDERYSSMQEGFNQPRIVIQVYPVTKTEIELEEGNEHEVDPMTQSYYGTFNFQAPKKGPFSAKRVIHQSDTPHAKTPQEDIDELVIPGDKQEISDFIELTTQSARIQLEINLPTLTLQLVSKHVYEVLYNHISSDLLLWEPGVPAPKTQQTNDANPYQVSNFEMHETYAMCKSGIQYDSDSDSSEDIDPENSNVFYSVYESRNKLMQRKQQTVQLRGQSYLTLNLHIGQGLLCLNPPVRDVAINVIPEQHGEFVLCVEEANVFSVTGYNGDDNLGYVCVQSKGAQLHHCDMFTTPSQCPPLKEIGTALARHLHPTIYKSEPGMLANCKDRGGNREMVSVAVRIQANHETHHVKTVRVALGINKATLRHRMCLEPNSWITQLIDFFNVNDYTIPGYHAKEVLTELHLHLWDCAIDYRPFHLPLRSVVTLGTFSMSSHLSATANTSTLRFIAEECGLFLSEKAPPKNGVPSSAPIDLKLDYVSVVDLGLFELSLRTNDKTSGINPHIDLRASNNIVNIRTCSDSGRALTQLITYFASDGDLVPSEESPVPASAFSSPRHDVEQELISVEQQDISNLSKSQHQHVNELLGEAMEESLSVEERNVDPNSFGAKMFFFPDEGQAVVDNSKPPPQVTTELGDVTFRSNKSSDTDEEFCIIGEEAGLGILPKNGLPEIRWLSDDPLRVIDNHFNVPIGKTDILKPPKHFPVPVMRYTLCNMTIVWQLYGGNDFKLPDSAEKKEKKTVNFSDLQVRDGVGYSNTHTGEVIFNKFVEKRKPKLNWLVQGGVNRNHDVLIELELNKVRFQHEVYPENTSQASRQVLLVTEIEVRDLLQSSEINKFLYQYTSQSRPKQSHAHMIAIKAVHIRPDLKLKAQECCLRVSALPLRLNIDQDSLLFLINFFNELSGTTTKTNEVATISSKHNTPTHQPPVMTVSTSNDQLIEQAQKLVDDNLLLLLDDVKSIKDDEKAQNVSKGSSDNSLPIYFRKIIFTPDVPIRLDYHGKRLDLTHGPLAGLIMGLGQLNSSELRLRRLSNNHGILGFDKLMTYCLQEWINDIKKNQLPSLLGGVGPMHSLVQFFQGIRDLFWLPIEQYQKDGRIVRGLQRGANSFTTSTAMAALELTSRIIHLIQITAETAYDMMSPGPSVRRAIKSKGRKRRYNQPQDIREGMANAYNVVKEGFEETAENIVRIASHEREQKGYSGAVGGVLRQIPPTFVKPIIIASEATNNVLGGMQSQLLPDSKREANQKWKNNEG